MRMSMMQSANSGRLKKSENNRSFILFECHTCADRYGFFLPEKFFKNLALSSKIPLTLVKFVYKMVTRWEIVGVSGK